MATDQQPTPISSTLGQHLVLAEQSLARLLLFVLTKRVQWEAIRRACTEAENWDSMNLSLALSKLLLEMPKRQRSLRAPSLIADLLAGTEPILLDHIELLFEPSLKLDPLRVLKSASRRRPLAAIWPGTWQEGYLMYAQPGHHEYRRYDSNDLSDVTVVDPTAIDWEG